jgi:hypothetical protein
MEKSNKMRIPRFIIAILGAGIGAVFHQISNGRILAWELGIRIASIMMNQCG